MESSPVHVVAQRPPIPHFLTPTLSQSRGRGNPPPNWCKITYFELDAQVGDSFKVPYHCDSVCVDGYVDPNKKDRFCLGALSNVHRTDFVEHTRIHIGKGIRLYHDASTGDVYILCLSDNSIFVQSFYMDKELENGVNAAAHSGPLVHKVCPGVMGCEMGLKIFDMEACIKTIRDKVGDAYQAQTDALALDSSGGIANVLKLAPHSQRIGVDELRKLCYIRLSFVKGWGPDYKRKDIKETPCWIEVHLNRGLQVLDEILQQFQNFMIPT